MLEGEHERRHAHPQDQSNDPERPDHAQSYRQRGPGLYASGVAWSIRASTAREVASSATPTTTISREMTTAPPLSGVLLQLSPARSGASSTGSTVCALNTSGATWAAGRVCKAVFSLSTPITAAHPTRLAHTHALSQACADRSSETSFVMNPLSANATPALSTVGNPCAARRLR